MSKDTTVAFVHEGAPEVLFAAVLKSIESMGLKLKEEYKHYGRFRIKASEPLKLLSMNWPVNFTIESTFSKGNSTLIIRAGSFLTSWTQESSNQAKANELLNLIKIFAENLPENTRAIEGIIIPKPKNDNKILGCGAILFLLIIVIIIAVAASGGDKNTEPSSYTLNANVRFTGTQFEITNNDTFDWYNVEFELNSPGLFSSGYLLDAPVLHAGKTYTVGAMQFALSDGTRFNPFTMKANQISIACDVGNKRGYYTGKW